MKKEEFEQRRVARLARMISRAEQVCLAKDCLTCEYAKYVEQCYPMRLAVSLLCQGVKLKDDSANEQGQTNDSDALTGGGQGKE